VTSLAYRFPPPGDRAEWEAKVRQAIKDTHLVWTHLDDTQWILAGECPRCHHQMSQLVDTEVVVASAGITTYSYVIVDDRLRTEVVCNCDEPEPHKKDTKGCGYGKGLLIGLDRPVPVGGDAPCR